MKKAAFLITVFLLSSLLYAEEEYGFRDLYRDSYEKMININRAIHYKDGVERSGRLGIGLSGSLLFKVQAWEVGDIQDGFLNLDLVMPVSPYFNITGGAGYHMHEQSQVIPVFAALQFVFAGEEIQKWPSSTGIEAGLKYFSSNMAGESQLYFMLGLCHYTFYSKSFALFAGFDWIPAYFRGCNVEWKTGVIFYLV